MTAFEDHFSERAELYARARPLYPDALFSYLAERAPTAGVAWDAATGSGQAACALAPHFNRVVATDASAAQLEAAKPHPRVEYRVARSERSGIEDGTVDLITVAAALHWFDLPDFFAEVRRVARPGACLAAWTYGPQVLVHPAVDPLLERLADGLVAEDWPAGFAKVRAGYADIDFPFAPIETPAFTATMHWDVDTMLGHLRSWSGVQRHHRRTGDDPVLHIEREFRSAWAEAGESHLTIRWPLALRAGRVEQGEHSAL